MPRVWVVLTLCVGSRPLHSVAWIREHEDGEPQRLLESNMADGEAAGVRGAPERVLV